MSSTNRTINKREKTDYYVTPTQPIKDFLSEWFTDLQKEEDYNSIPERPDKQIWFDPCAGGDKNHGMSYADTIRQEFDAMVITLDIRKDSKAVVIADYLTYKTEQKPDIIISNPPFMHAEAFIRKALQDVAPDGYVVMLLRLNFLGSQARKKFFEEHMPKHIYVHRKRMSFTDDKKTDSIEYAHFVWKEGYHPQKSLLKVI